MYFSLLKEWCDALVALQITDPTDATLYGGILCPSCGRIHGRCGDAVFPLMTMAKRTGNPLYLERAKILFQWSEHNMARPDGAYINDTNSLWKGITVFAAIQLGEALYHHGDLLDSSTYQLWEHRLRIAMDFMYDNIDGMQTNINYPVTCAAAMAVAGRHFNQEGYHTKARALAHKAVESINQDGLLVGEGRQPDVITKQRGTGVDLGYNVEESLAALVLYATLEEDDEIMDIVQKSLEAHLAFMLPDGAWDNSWGSRSNKWTYWGSRTSDGAQTGYAPLIDKNPAFAEAVYRNTKLMADCTHHGLLHGGAMYHTAGEPPCVHHTFTHAKAMASLVMMDRAPLGGSAALPRETATGITSYPSIETHLIAQGPWRATLTAYPFDYVVEGHATGGSLTMLWHPLAGPVCVGTMTNYQLVEPNNMQLPQRTEEISHTPRLEYQKEGAYYRSCNDKTAQLTFSETQDSIVATATGVLRNGAQEGEESYSITYTFTDTGVSFAIKTSAENAVFRLPVISSHNETILDPQENRREIQRINHRLTVECQGAVLTQESQELILNPAYTHHTPQKYSRVFNPVGGFEALPLAVEVSKDTLVTIALEIK